MHQENLPLVTVICTSFNHESFIRECLDGFVLQKTTFPFEVIVHDDASTDSTQQIVKEYQSKHPRLFNNIYQTENQFTKKEVNIWIDIMFPKARGKYIAICEGDDYWTDPYKLQKQVDFLENNSDFSLCCGGYISINTITGEKKEIVIGKYDLKDKNGFSFTLKEMEKDWITKTLTSVFRSNCLEFSLLNQYSHFRDIHLFYHIMLSKKGYYFNTVFGAYNIHLGGVNSMQHGIVNFNANYNSFKELYFYNKDEFTRNMYLKGTLSLLSYDIYNHYPNNTINRRIKLFKEAVLLVRNIVEIKWLLNSFLSREFKDKFKKVN
jgi:glycosyltransferase involved in cell wall biosynthesis